MLTELLYKLRGAENWPQTDATVSSCEWGDNANYRSKGPEGWYTVTFSYRVNGEYYGGDFTLPGSSDSSTPYQKDDKLVAHYNPRNPEKNFLEGVSDTKARAQQFLVILTLGFVLLLLIIGLLSRS